MNLADLQIWLRDEGIRDDLNAITRMTVRTEIDNLQPDPTKFEIDWPRLLLAGSILARSDQRADQEAALRIATGSIGLGGEQTIVDAGAVLLSKLSNFRAVDLPRLRT